jgi:hypothetical protein
MPFTPASPASVWAFTAIVVAVVAAFLAAVRHASLRGPEATGASLTRAAFGVAVWLGVVSAAVGSGSLERLPMSGLPFFFGSVLVVSLYTGLSGVGGRLASAVPIAALVLFQGFRLPLELVLHAWAEQGTIPGTMTWSGQNWDVVSGIAALVAAPFATRHLAVAWVVNVVGMVLLLNVMRVALLSSPVPFGWGTEPPLTLALHLPYALVGPVCVGGALVGHIVLTRALLSRRQ